MGLPDLAELIARDKSQRFVSHFEDDRISQSSRLAVLPHLGSFVRFVTDAMTLFVRQEPVLKVDGQINRALATSGTMYDAFVADLQTLATSLTWDQTAVDRAVSASFASATHNVIRAHGARVLTVSQERRQHHQALYSIAAVALCEDRWHSAIRPYIELLGVGTKYLGKGGAEDLIAVDQSLDFSESEVEEGLQAARQVAASYRGALDSAVSLGGYMIGSTHGAE